MCDGHVGFSRPYFREKWKASRRIDGIMKHQPQATILRDDVQRIKGGCVVCSVPNPGTYLLGTDGKGSGSRFPSSHYAKDEDELIPSIPIPTFCGYFAIDPQGDFSYTRRRKEQCLITSPIFWMWGSVDQGRMVNAGNRRKGVGKGNESR